VPDVCTHRSLRTRGRASQSCFDMETNREISVPELTQAGRERTGTEDGGWRMEDGGW